MSEFWIGCAVLAIFTIASLLSIRDEFMRQEAALQDFEHDVFDQSPPSEGGE